MADGSVLSCRPFLSSSEPLLELEMQGLPVAG